jgi:hypothetical protein
MLADTDSMSTADDPLPLVPPDDTPPAIQPTGRDSLSGRFVAGNQLGRGNPHARRAASLRGRFFSIFTPDQFERVVRAVIEKAASGDVAAAKLLCEYGLGRPEAMDLIVLVRKLQRDLEGGADDAETYCD